MDSKDSSCEPDKACLVRGFDFGFGVMADAQDPCLGCGTVASFNTGLVVEVGVSVDSMTVVVCSMIISCSSPA